MKGDDDKGATEAGRDSSAGVGGIVTESLCGRVEDTGDLSGRASAKGKDIRKTKAIIRSGVQLYHTVGRLCSECLTLSGKTSGKKLRTCVLRLKDSR